MLKNNKVFYLVAGIVSVLLLVLWFVLGFNRVDAPLDLVLSIVWWVLIVVAIYMIFKVEKKRRFNMRAVYVKNGGALFSPELGAVVYENYDLLTSVAKVIGSLKYSFDMQEIDDGKMTDVRYIIYTDEIQGDGDKAWKGYVVSFGADGKRIERAYSSKEELADLVA